MLLIACLIHVSIAADYQDDRPATHNSIEKKKVLVALISCKLEWPLSRLITRQTIGRVLGRSNCSFSSGSAHKASIALYYKQFDLTIVCDEDDHVVAFSFPLRLE